jgi:hypothetical protein
MTVLLTVEEDKWPTQTRVATRFLIHSPLTASLREAVADHARGGTSPRLMMSYFSFNATISFSSANCASLNPASSSIN